MGRQDVVRKIAFAILVLAGALVMNGGSARATELVMFEDPACAWCRRWHVEIGPAYPLTAEGQAAPRCPRTVITVDARADEPVSQHLRQATAVPSACGGGHKVVLIDSVPNLACNVFPGDPLAGEGCNMSRLSDHQDSDIVCEYYGINRDTLRVECVSETKGGVLSLMRGGNYRTHPLIGKDGEEQCKVAFDLVEIQSVRGTLIADQGHTDAIRAELRDKATKMRVARGGLEAKRTT